MYVERSVSVRTDLREYRVVGVRGGGSSATVAIVMQYEDVFHVLVAMFMLLTGGMVMPECVPKLLRNLFAADASILDRLEALTWLAISMCYIVLPIILIYSRFLQCVGE